MTLTIEDKRLSLPLLHSPSFFSGIWAVLVRPGPAQVGHTICQSVCQPLDFVLLWLFGLFWSRYFLNSLVHWTQRCRIWKMSKRSTKTSQRVSDSFRKKWHYSMFSSKTYLLQPWFPRKCTCSSQNSDRSVPGLLSASLQRLGNLPSSREFRRSSVRSGGPWTSVQCQCVQDLFAPPADCTAQEMATGSGKTSVKASNKDIRGIQKLQTKMTCFIGPLCSCFKLNN